LSTIKVNNIQSRTGSAISFTSGDTITIPSGATLTNNGTANGFPGLGKIGQVVQATDQTATTISASAGTFYVAGASASITPTSASSKILVQISLSAVQNTNGNSITKLVRTAPSTVALLSNTGGSNINGTFGGVFNGDSNFIHSLNFSYLDSPSTTSLCTYTSQVGCSGAITFYVNRSVGDTVRASSTMTLMEVLA
jgi:hypothetical protein